MKKRMLVLVLLALLLLSAAIALYTIWLERSQTPQPLPPEELPSLSEPKEQKEPAKQEVPNNEENEDEEEEPSKHTVRVPLEKEDLVKEPATPETSLSLKKPKARQVLPGVTVEDKELNIQLEKANESLSIRRRPNSSDEQVQMLWKQKF